MLKLARRWLDRRVVVIVCLILNHAPGRDRWGDKFIKWWNQHVADNAALK